MLFKIDDGLFFHGGLVLIQFLFLDFSSKFLFGLFFFSLESRINDFFFFFLRVLKLGLDWEDS